ncbi:hypothetical protein [Arenibaculum pallidiluteum]|uniref:hypothetical protein n=1 Tax=Arenibaculum pallidiluteum TaxID=2812559 RepID=UPI001A96AA4A|nr:hypothetical protein [Arenibaculum pallidiluteum]
MTDDEVAAELRQRIAELNAVLATAARGGLKVELESSTHQTAGGAPMVVVEARIYKQL